MTSDGDLDIRGGGLVAVDTEALRAAAVRLRATAGECEGIRAALERAGALLAHAGLWFAIPGEDAGDAAQRSRRLAGDLDTMADTYEVVELDQQIALAEAGGSTALARDLRARMNALLAHDPTILARVLIGGVAWRTETTRGLVDQYALAAIGHSGVAVLVTGLVALLGRGTVPRGTTLSGPPDPVAITRIAASPAVSAGATAPASVTQIADRIPSGEARVRVERYTMSDGSRAFAAYVSGTVGGGGDEAFDWDSNVEMYLARSDAASYDALRAALLDAGAAPGESVILAGYSQGGMDASYLALSGEYDVPLLVTFGDPVQADVGESTLSVALRHTDDPVASLAAGGFAGTVGAEGSFVATREVPGSLLTGDELIGPHGLADYRETAQMLDASSDPRLDEVAARLDALGRAEQVEVFVYSAARTEERPLRVSADAAGAG